MGSSFEGIRMSGLVRKKEWAICKAARDGDRYGYYVGLQITGWWFPPTRPAGFFVLRDTLKLPPERALPLWTLPGKVYLKDGVGWRDKKRRRPPIGGLLHGW